MGLFFIGLFGLLTQKHLIKTFMSIAIMESALFIFFIGNSFIPQKSAPIFQNLQIEFSQMNDPIPHAMILTAIVIGMAVVALGVSFSIEYYHLTKKSQIDEINDLRY